MDLRVYTDGHPFTGYGALLSWLYHVWWPSALTSLR